MVDLGMSLNCPQQQQQHQQQQWEWTAPSTGRTLISERQWRRLRWRENEDPEEPSDGSDGSDESDGYGGSYFDGDEDEPSVVWRDMNGMPLTPAALRT